ncbi:hypothetical protein G7046_g4967 [Stylonectria norvegica]|nr:hypothetical protein G7046_g4967 [Stylonectria norvegica]
MDIEEQISTSKMNVQDEPAEPVERAPPRKRARQEVERPDRSQTSQSPSADSSAMSSRAENVTYNFIGNEFILSESRSWMKLSDPTSQKFITRVPESTSVEVNRAVSTAVAAQPAWAATSLSKRRSLVLDLMSVIRQHGARIYAITLYLVSVLTSLQKHSLCVEVGKTSADADAEFERGLDSIQTACGVSYETAGGHYSSPMGETYTIHEPLGVCLSITPFNFPFMIPLWSIPAAILAGNTFVLKPSERAPTVISILAECFRQSAIPPGVLNIIHGSGTAVDLLLAQPAIRTVSFVGSDIVGERVCEHARATRKRVQAECSGKNHGVVMIDANKQKTLYAIVGSAFGAAGQRCMALSVVILVGDTKQWLGELIELAASLVVGAPLDSNVDVGPVISASAKTRIKHVIDNAEAEGATVLLDGRNCEVPKYPDGNFVGPTIISNVKPYMSCYQEEIFGPVLICMEVGTLEEAIKLINSNRYGNGCTLFTGSPITAQLFQRTVNVGQIGINIPILAPYGAVLRSTNKDSFLGDNNAHGRGTWQFFTETKTINTLWHQ